MMLPKMGPPTPASSRRSVLILFAVAAILGALVHTWLSRENPYEHVAHDMTVALQRDDLAAVESFQNAETATEVNHARVGRAADALAPLGVLKSVKETGADLDRRVYDFDLTFEHGKLHETIRFDPQNKVVAFHYDPPVKT